MAVTTLKKLVDLRKMVSCTDAEIDDCLGLRSSFKEYFSLVKDVFCTLFVDKNYLDKIAKEA